MMSNQHREAEDRHRGSRQYLHYLLYLVPIFILLLCYGGLILATNEPSPFTIVLGPSMQPTILPGSVAVIDKVPFDQLKPGDVIVFVPQVALISRCDSGPTGSLIAETSIPCFVIHRIVRIATDQSGNRIVTTKGDNNPSSILSIDTGINDSMYIGKVIMQFPVAGYLTTTPTNEIVVILIFAAFVADMLYERYSTRRAEKSFAEKKKAEEGEEERARFSGGDGEAQTNLTPK